MGQFILNGKVKQVGKDSADAGIDQDTTVLTGWTATLESNYPKGVPLPDNGDVDYLDVRTITLLSDGSITEDGVNAGISLTAHDPAVFATPLQWTIQPGTVTLVSGKSFRPKKWTFNAPLDGVSATLGGLTPVVGIPLQPAPGATPWDSVTGKPVVIAAGATQAEARAAIGISGGGGEWESHANLAAFPATGNTNQEYLAQDTGKLYRWTGSVYLQIADKAAVGLGNVDNTADTAKPVSTAQQTAIVSTGARSLAVKTKSLGGNIVVKPGYNWRHLWSEWDWDNWIRPQIDRAIKLGLRGVRLISGPRVTTDSTISWNAWAASTAYTVDQMATLGGRVYRCTTAGTSASSGGPTGTGTSITDNTVTWTYARQDDLVPIAQGTYDARWVQLVQYCATKGLDVYPCICQAEDYDAVSAGNFQNSTVTTSITTTAAALAAYPNVIAFDVFQEGDLRTGTAWVASRSYSTGVFVNNGGKSYQATTGGTAASSGGPTGTGTGITDGTVTWAYAGVPLLKADVLALLAAIRAVCNVPIGFSMDPSKFGFAWHDAENLWYLCLVDPAGPDFCDIHIYNQFTLPADVDFFATTGKPLLIGEFGPNQSLSSDNQIARITSIAPIHQREGVIGSFVWGLADQGGDPTRQAGVWDNTGFVQGSAPLSTTAGARAALAGPLRQMAIAPIARTYEYPNLASPARARPPRGLTAPGGFSGAWTADTNTALIADGRGLGAQCVAGGSTSGLYINNPGNKALFVVGNTWYRMIFEVVADTVGRVFNVFIDWYDDAGTLLVRSPGTGDTFQSTDAVNLPVRLDCLVKSHASATRGRPTIRWSTAQATNEVHILRSFRLEQA